MDRVVLDSSAILAFLQDEPGGEIVADYCGNALVSAVNVAEVTCRLNDLGADLAEAKKSIAFIDMEIVPFDAGQAYDVASIRKAVRPLGLSLGGRVCMQLAMRLNLPVLTADRAWAKIELDVEVRLVRG